MWRHDLKLFACRGGYNRAPWHGRELKERHRMRIWVDADACPGVIKEILFRAAERAAVSLTLVANKPLRVPRSPHIRTVQVAGGFDVADRWIAGEVATESKTKNANKPQRKPQTPQNRTVQVAGGFDVADRWIAGEVATGDLVITADIPLAAAVIEKGAQALNPRGELYTANTIRERLRVRDFMDQLRGSGVNTGGPPALSAAERHAFAQHLDRLLSM